MLKVLVAGASGTLGFNVVKKLQSAGYQVIGQIFSPEKREKVAPYCDRVWVADLTKPEDLDGICEGVDIAFSAVGKSVSLFNNSALSFIDLDFRGNLHLMQEALKAGVKRFVYVSIFGSEISPKMRQGWSHELFAQNVLHHFPSCTVIKAVGMFSGLNDLLILGKTGLVITPGSGKHRTNPIHQRDLAEVCITYLKTGPCVVEVGGPEVHTRNEVAEQVCQVTRCIKTINVPTWLVKPCLLLVRIFSRNLYDKLLFFTYITTHDMIAPRFGKLRFRDYLREKSYLK